MIVEHMSNMVQHYIGPRFFTVHESVPTRFHTPIFIGDCKQIAPRSNSATGNITAGQTLNCFINNFPQ